MGAIKGRVLEIISCPFCSYTTKRVTSIETHIGDVHGKTPPEAWVEVHGPSNCRCGCGTPTKWLGWKRGFTDFVNGHNASIYSYMDQDDAREVVEKRNQTLKNSMQSGDVVHWARGLTKESNETLRVAATKRAVTVKQQYDSGERSSWSKGLNKETDQRIKTLSQTLKDSFVTGSNKIWSAGLTKDTDDRIKGMATKVSLALRKEVLRKRLDQYKRLKEDEVRSRIEKDSNLTVIGGLERYVNDASPVIKVKCLGCGAEFYDSLRRLQRGRCYVCQPAGSAVQQEISDYLTSLGVNINRNDRTMLNGLEIDIFIPSHNLGIEYNGLYWHSDLHKSSTYHDNKTKVAKRQGVTLLHVFEDDWRDHPDIIKSMILHRMKMTPRCVGARKLKLAKLDKKTREEFFEANHIDGDVASLVAWGLFLGSELVSALSVRKPFHKSHSDHYEVARFCTKTYTHVPGALQRLTKVALNFVATNSKAGLMTYVDMRIGTGSGYESSGFVKISETPPRFWWTDFDNRFNRFKFKADPTRGLSEAEVAAEVGVVKIWGCSNLVYRMGV